MTDTGSSRLCPACGLQRPRGDFGWRDKAHTRPQSYCRECMREAWRCWYADDDNRQRHVEAVGRRRRRRITRLRALVRSHKDVPCADCGVRHPPAAMDFDHVRGAKVGEISQLVYVAGEDRLRAELAKCEVVCANCHRLRTARRRRGPAADIG